MEHDEWRVGKRPERPGPPRDRHVEALEEIATAGGEVGTLAGSQSRERLEDGRGDRPRILGVEPVVRVPEAMNMLAAPRPDPRGLGLQEVDAFGAIEDIRAAREEARVANGLQQPCQPRLVIQADLDEQRRAAKRRDLPWLDLDGMRIVKRRGERFDAHAVAADRLDEGLEVGGRGDDGERGAAPPGGGGGAPQERRAQKRPPHPGSFFPRKIALPTPPPPPLPTSPTPANP